MEPLTGRKRDAIVLRAEPLDQTRRMAALGTEVLALDRRWALLAEVNRMEKRGEVRKLGRDPIWDHQAGEWQMRVIRLKKPAPRWRRPLLIAVSILAPLLTFFGLLWWVLTALAALPLMFFCGVAVLALAALVARGRPGRTITIEQKVTIR